MIGSDSHIVLVGCGKMGGALLAGLMEKKLDPKNIKVIQPSLHNADRLKQVYNIDVLASPTELAEDFRSDVILLAVKPQILDNILPIYKEVARENTLFISIAAGKKISFFEEHLSKDAAIVRSMPNLPSLVGRGVSVAIANSHVSFDQQQIAANLLGSVGECYFVDDETMLDAVTALSGSGPAYVFHFLESLLEAGKQLGLPTQLTRSLAYSTLIGSAEMACSSDRTAAELRKQVTSPNGTTEAALKVLMKNNAFEKLLVDAIKAARDRSVELGS